MFLICIEWMFIYLFKIVSLPHYLFHSFHLKYLVCQYLMGFTTIQVCSVSTQGLVDSHSLLLLYSQPLCCVAMETTAIGLSASA